MTPEQHFKIMSNLRMVKRNLQFSKTNNDNRGDFMQIIAKTTPIYSEIYLLNNNPNITLNSERSAIKIIFMYASYWSPIRNINSIEIINAMMTSEGVSIKNIGFLKITHDDDTDKKNLDLLYKTGNCTLFVSALGSSDCSRLQDLFFAKDEIPIGVSHINSFSTATSLTGSKNLIRVRPPDTGNIKIFETLSGPFSVVYQGYGIWASGICGPLYNNLNNEANKTVEYVLNTSGGEENNEDVLALVKSIEIIYNSQSFNNEIDKITLFLITSYSQGLVSLLINSEEFAVYKNYCNIVFGDATPTHAVTAEVFDLYNICNVMVVEPLTTASDIYVQNKLNTILGESIVDSTVVFEYSAMNVADNLDGIAIPNRSSYYVAANMTFLTTNNNSKNNNTAYYSALSWKDKDTLTINTLFISLTEINGGEKLYTCTLE
jgi:hypothetical protein